MYCPRCGVENAADARTCVSCGFDLTPPVEPEPARGVAPRPGATPPPPAARYPQTYPGPPHQPPSRIPNYLPQAITLTVIGLCCWFLPSAAGIPAIVFASQVDTKLQVGDVGGALEASRMARIWCWISFGLVIMMGMVQLSIFALPFAAVFA